MPRRRRLVWHRRDLRVQDNELYHFHHRSTEDEEKEECISLYVFDSHYFHPQPSISCPDDADYKTVWCGPFAAQTLIEAVTSLRSKLRSIGGELLVRTGDPAILVPQIVQQVQATEVIFGEEPGTYERQLVHRIFQHDYLVQNSSVRCTSVAGYTLYHPNDLPIEPSRWNELAHPKQTRSKKKKNSRKLQHNNVSRTNSTYEKRADWNLVNVTPERLEGMCRIMGDFRKAARRSAQVRNEWNAPAEIQLPSAEELPVDIGSIPSLEDLTKPLLQSKSTTILGMDREVIELVVKCAIEQRKTKEPRTEQSAVERLDYFVSTGRAARADRSKVDVVSNDDSSRLSVHLALGTISPRTIYWKVNQTTGDNDCNWLASHLEMRDFFLYTAFAQGNRLFSPNGLPPCTSSSTEQKNKKRELVVWKSPSENSDRWKRWAIGKTQLPLVDAGIRELLATGYLSNRVRQNVASFLAKDLQIDWRAGAEWFQFLLEDHCVGANYGNWLYFSGVGPDPKNLHFRTVSQMKRYDDANGNYVRKWIPSLRGLDDAEAVFRPWDFEVPGFATPIVDPKSQYTWQDAQCIELTKQLLDSDN